MCLHYPDLYGRTGNAGTFVDEIEEIFKLTVTMGPLNKPMIRMVGEQAGLETWRHILDLVMPLFSSAF